MRRSFSSGLALGASSHLLSSVFPFLAAACLKQGGIVGGACAIYLVGTASLLLARPLHGREGAQLVAYLRGERKPYALRLALIAFAVAAVSYYLGLGASRSTLGYVFVTRLDWAVQIPVAIIFLREPWSLRSVGGALFAFGGALLLGRGGAVGVVEAGWALLYLASSAVGYTMITPLLREGRGPALADILVARHLLITVALSVWAVGASDLAHLLSVLNATGLAAGVVLALIFFSRFAALRTIPLSLFATLAPLQALGAVLITVARGDLLTPPLLAGGALVLLGELLALTNRTPPR